MRRLSGVGLTWVLVLTAGCESVPPEPTLFELLPPERTGISFANFLPEEPDFNILNYLYYYNGGGVAVGDVNNNGLPDLYFTSNLGSDRLYLNEGDFRFRDVTEEAGLDRVEGWTTGVTMADVTGNGFLDIYVSTVTYLDRRSRNALFVNNGDGTFSDRTEEFGLTHVGYSTQALFFDYNGSGRLDMFLLNHSVFTEEMPYERVGFEPRRSERHPRAGDRLFRNEGDRFVDVSEDAGIFGGVEGFGIGVVASDFTLNGCPDLFVANDFQENDFLYLNNCDGTFSEASDDVMTHSSRFSMGVDAADFSNNGRPDLVVLDMLPADEEILKTSANAENVVLYRRKIQAGYGPQYARNTLQLNLGVDRFSEIGYMAGVYATDWSWAALFADLDNSGWKDLFITNGIYRRPNDLDYISYIANDAVRASLDAGITDADMELLERMPQIPLANYAFRNNRDLTFTNQAEEWGLANPGFSTGAAYVDLNNDGALDLVVNNINAPASVYRNRARELTGNHYLKVELVGDYGNSGGIGSKVKVWHDDQVQFLEHMPTRGWQSSVDHRLHFGMGQSTTIDSLRVVWPDHRFQVLRQIDVDQVLTLRHEDAGGEFGVGSERDDGRVLALFHERDREEYGLSFSHRENTFWDWNREALLHQLISREGPALAVGDVNGSGLDDLYFGGARGQPGVLYLQAPDGRFEQSQQTAFVADSLHEDVDAVFLDANGNGSPDLYVVSGGNEFEGLHEALIDRLYLNDGEGRFTRASDALPDMFENGAVVAPGDFNGNGYQDLFVGGRTVAGAYGRSPRSYLLANDGAGRFRDVTLDMAPEIARVGMVTSAVWADLDGDGKLELVVVGEWMPVSIFKQEGTQLVERTIEAGLEGTHGWWNVVEAADLTGDGNQDLVLGNLGLNSYIKGSADEPVRLYVHDFSGNGALEHILTFYKGGKSYPMAGRDELSSRIPQLRSQYIAYSDFGASTIEDIFPPSELEGAEVLQARVLESSVALNQGDGTFELRPLPIEAQFSQIRDVLVNDFTGSGKADLLVAGNFHGVKPMRGRYAGSYGLLLEGEGDGHFRAVEPMESGIIVDGEVRKLGLLGVPGGGHVVVFARNNREAALLETSH